ncbi:MAG: hypothetical protein H0V70_16295 [Ktedonobacteraceae bacterium]|nr:hypothetical protein [Ktedonobacteraceae bacterium]
MLLSGKQTIHSIPINTDQACQLTRQDPAAIARLADYYDAASWQCYAHGQKLGGIVNYLDSHCKYRYNTGRAPIARNTAYDWECLDQHNKPVGIAITDACQWYYKQHSTDAFDRLVNFSRPDGWGCWSTGPN